MCWIGDLAEMIPALFHKAYGNAGGKSDGSPAYKIALEQCPDGKRAWQYGGGRDIEVDPVVFECAACDAIHLGSLDAAVPERATTTVTPRKREQVLARDGHRCTVPGCRRNTGLDLHHIEFQSHGGSHDLRNITSVCNLHHKALHAGKLVIRGAAPDGLAFELRQPRDRRNVTGDDAPELGARASMGPSLRGAPSRVSAMDQSHVDVPRHAGAARVAHSWRSSHSMTSPSIDQSHVDVAPALSRSARSSSVNDSVDARMIQPIHLSGERISKGQDPSVDGTSA